MLHGTGLGFCNTSLMCGTKKAQGDDNVETVDIFETQNRHLPGLCFCSKASECMRSVGWGQAAVQAVAGVGPKISPEILSTFICSCTNQQVASCQGDNKEEEEGKDISNKKAETSLERCSYQGRLFQRYSNPQKFNQSPLTA